MTMVMVMMMIDDDNDDNDDDDPEDTTSTSWFVNFVWQSESSFDWKWCSITVLAPVRSSLWSVN